MKANFKCADVIPGVEDMIFAPLIKPLIYRIL